MIWAVEVERVTRETYWVEARTQPEACEVATKESARQHNADEHHAVKWAVAE